jgi:4,5-DOPA dioxygenase extradiol
MPAVFFGHGNPMNAIETNAFTTGWSALGRSLPRPRAILSVSAHWYVPFTGVTVADSPRTIHDFGGFPNPLYEVQYRAPGSPSLAARVRELLRPLDVQPDAHWGLDHGTWSVLVHAYPEADVRSCNSASTKRAMRPGISRPPAGWRHCATKVCSSSAAGTSCTTCTLTRGQSCRTAVRLGPAVRNDGPRSHCARRVRVACRLRESRRDALLSAPTPDHYLPLVYVLAQHGDGDAVSFPVEGFDGGSISMLAVQIG